MVDYNQSSRYYKVDNQFDLAQNNLLRLNHTYTTTIVQLSEKGRLDLVSLRVYNTPVNWWIIARFNSILDPNLIFPGMELHIPSLS